MPQSRVDVACDLMSGTFSADGLSGGFRCPRIYTEAEMEALRHG